MAKDGEILLCRCVAPNNELHKHDFIDKRKHIKPVIYKEGCSILTPHIIIKTPEKLLQYNYLYSYDFERDYFIEDVIVLPQGQVELVCRVDVLYSFREAIMDLVVHEERATNGQSNLIVDEQVPLMHNNVVKDIINLNMVVGDEFIVRDTDNMKYLVTHYTAKFLEGGGGQGNHTGDYDWGDANSATQNKCRDTAEKANWYYDEFQKWKQKIDSYEKASDRNAIISGGSYYTQGDDLYSGTSGEITSNTDWTASFNLNNTARVKPSRLDTAYLDEANAVSALRYTGTYYQNYNALPQAIKNANAVWNGWDCSQFAWRCAFFGSGYDLIRPDLNDGSGGGSVTSVAIACAMLNYCLVKTSYDPIDCSFWVTNENLLPGDIIISGNISNTGGGSYWLIGKWDNNKRRMFWYYANHLSSEPRVADSAVKARFDIGAKDYIMFVNHARVVVDKDHCIESVAPDKGMIKNYNGALQKNTTPTITLEKGTYVNYLVASSGTSKYHFIVLRPSYLYYLLNQETGWSADPDNPSPLVQRYVET